MMSNFQQQPRANMGYINSVISWGAGFVIIGLMFKILHWPGGQIIIGASLGVEAFLFFILGFKAMPGHKAAMDVSKSGTSDQTQQVDKNTIAKLNTQEFQRLDAEQKVQNLRNSELNDALRVREGELKIAKKLKDLNVSYDVITKCTGLSMEDILML